MSGHCVYFAGTESESLYNIGISSRPPAKRLREHNRGLGPSGDRLVFLFAVGAQPSDEGYIKRAFLDERTLDPETGRKTEWYERSERLDRYVRWCARQGFACRNPDIVPARAADFTPEDGREHPGFLSLAYEPWSSVVPVIPPHGGKDFHTHSRVMKCARDALGHIDLDPASHADANLIVKADRFFDVNENGLNQTWWGRVWLNPPFGAWETWAPKIASEIANVDEMILLMPTRAITAICVQPIRDNASAIAVLNRRFAFSGKKATSSPDEGHVLFYFGPSVQRFREAMCPIAVTWAA